MSKVELRLTEVEPPAPDPPRTIYTDLVNLPDPARLGLTCRIFNYDDVGLYMRVDGYNASWTFTSNDLGLLGSGANMYRNLDNFGSRAKPAAELEETITLRLRAYTDAGYTTLKWTYERTVTVKFIKSDDPSYTVDVLNNFDDGTVQGWAAVSEVGATAYIEVVSDYVLSSPYSVRLRQWRDAVGEIRGRLYKSFTTPNKDIIYAIMDIRQVFIRPDHHWSKYVEVRRDGTVLQHFGRTYDSVTEHYFVRDKWCRIVIPLPKNATLEIRIAQDYYIDGYTADTERLYMDDFKIISK